MVVVHGTMEPSSRRVGVLAGGFNPPTVAHEALLRAARPLFDSIVLTVPKSYPHKHFHGATLEDRVRMLSLLDPSLNFAVAVSDRGLFIDIARELRGDLAPEASIHFICGRDAAERIVSWDYGSPGEIERQLQEYKLLVASRQGEYRPPPHLAAAIDSLPMETPFDDVSSTVVRDLLIHSRDPQSWEPLVPKNLRKIVQNLYSR